MSEYQVEEVVEFLAGKQPVALAVAGQESHLPAFERPDDEGAGGLPERRPEADLASVFDAVDLVEPRAAQDADGGMRLLRFLGPGHEYSSD